MQFDDSSSDDSDIEDLVFTEEEDSEKERSDCDDNEDEGELLDFQLHNNGVRISDKLLNKLSEIDAEFFDTTDTSDSDDEMETTDTSDSDYEMEINTWVRNFNQLPVVPPFTGTPGLNEQEISGCSTPLDYYMLFVTSEIIKLMKSKTNAYAREKIKKAERFADKISHRSIYRTWKTVTESEIRRFLAVIIHMGIVKKPKIADYWSKNKVMHTSFAAQLMTRERFVSILSFFHLNDNSGSVPQGRPGHDPLHKIRPLFDHLNKRFKEVYTPTSDVSIDEAMCPWKGQLHFRTYMKDKPVKWGIKLYELCESMSGYMYSFEIMCHEPGVSNKPVDVCMRLMEPLLGKGYTVYADNYYTCPDLCRKMAAQDTMVVGTVHSNRLGMPKDLVKQQMMKGQTDYRRNGNLVAIRYKDKRDVYLLTTKHTDEAVLVTNNTKGGLRVQKMKPKAVVDYIQHMAGVDRSDQLISYMPFHRKTVKWWKKLAFHLLSIAMIQASIVFNKHRKVRGEKPWKLQKFVVAVCQQLAECAQLGPTEYYRSNQQRQPGSDELNRLTGKHILTRIPALPSGRRRYRECALHYAKARASGLTRDELKNKKSKSIDTECVPCKKALCVECFGIYHTQVSFH